MLHQYTAICQIILSIVKQKPVIFLSPKQPARLQHVWIWMLERLCFSVLFFIYLFISYYWQLERHSLPAWNELRCEWHIWMNASHRITDLPVSFNFTVLASHTQTHTYITCNMFPSNCMFVSAVAELTASACLLLIIEDRIASLISKWMNTVRYRVESSARFRMFFFWTIGAWNGTPVIIPALVCLLLKASVRCVCRHGFMPHSLFVYQISIISSIPLAKQDPVWKQHYYYYYSRAMQKELTCRKTSQIDYQCCNGVSMTVFTFIIWH